MAAVGDDAAINDMLANKLEQIRKDASAWAVLCRHRDSGEYWELTYPQSELHGGGPRLLRCVGNDETGWRPLT